MTKAGFKKACGRLLLAVGLLGSMRAATAEEAQPPENQVFQFMVSGSTRWSDGRTGTATSYLWIPEGCVKVRGLLVLGNNVPEHKLVGHPAIRQVCAAADLGIVWSVPTFLNINEWANSVAFLERQLDGLAALSGYAEIATAPLLPLGESLHLKMVNALLDERPDRTIAGVLLKNPNLPPKNRVTPVLASFGTSYEWGQAATDIRTAWSTAGQKAYATLLEKRAAHPEWPISYVLDGHSGHFDCDERLIRFVARYVELAVKARLPKEGSGPLHPIDVKTGFTIDLPVPGHEGGQVAAETGRSGLPWYFDEAQAREARDIAAIDWNAKTQLPAYLDSKGNPLPFDFNGIPMLKALAFEPDGITFAVKGRLLDTIPRGFSSAGEPLAKGSAAIDSEWICGPVVPLAGDRFRIALDRTWLASHPVYVGLRVAGSESVRGIVMPAAVSLGIVNAPTGPDAASGITFDPIPDVIAGTESVAVSATAADGGPVRFFVQAGPAVVVDGRLRFTKIPPRAKYPIEVTVHAWRIGPVREAGTAQASMPRPVELAKRAFRILAADRGPPAP